MDYTVMSTRNFDGQEFVDFDKTGNKYRIYYRNKEKQEGTHKKFDTLEDALAVYWKFVEAFATGCYSYETRKSWLQ